MTRLLKKRASKRAITLVELIVAMTLTAIFAASCVVLMVPISKIYTHTNEMARAQMVADTVVNALRAECSRAMVTSADDAKIFDATNQSGKPGINVDSGNVLVIREGTNYFCSIASDYTINRALYIAVKEAEPTDAPSADMPSSDAVIVNRAVYRYFDSSADTVSADVNAGYLHYGYFNSEDGNDPELWNYYDYTNPLTFAAYYEYEVTLNFHDLNTSNNPYVLCDISVNMPSGQQAFSRTVALRFA